MTINIEKETDAVLALDEPEEAVIKRVIEESCAFEKCPYEAEVNVLLTDNASIRELNNEYRNVDEPTDVLSFPMLEYEKPADFGFIEKSGSEDCFNPDTGELMLGDIVISVEKVIEQSDAYGHSAKRELAFLTAHSMLHLFGYDHIKPEDAADMEDRQDKILSNINIPR